MAGRIASLALTGAVALVAGFAGAAAYEASGLGNASTRTYLVENPEILPQMAEALQRRDAQGRLADVRGDVVSPFPGAVLGNPQGSRTLVEFSDYNCGYCRLSTEHVDALIAADPELKVVLREWPIFDGSETLARMALAAAKQDKYAAFHNALFALDSRDEAAIEQAGQQAGLDMEQARADAAGDDISMELAKNQALAQRLNFSGTPSWVVGDTVLEGAVGQERLAEALAAGDTAGT